KAIKSLKKEGVVEQLDKLHQALSEVEPFDLGTIEEAVKQVAEELGVGGKINHALRAATTGRSVGPGVYDCVAILGKEKALANIAATKQALANDSLPEAQEP